MKLRVAFYYAGDLHKAAHVYSTLLGTSPIYADNDWVRFHLDGGDLALHHDPSLSEVETVEPIRYGAVVSLSVSDINATLALAQVSGFRQIGEIEVQPYGKQAHIRDPWGNRLSLIQPS